MAFIGPDGQVERSAVALFARRTPPAAAVCGGIGSQPAARLGASFFASGALIVDPFAQRVCCK
jgi:hypothetical protein